MPDPTKAELFDQLAKACKIRDEIFKFGSQNTTNYVNLLNDLVEALEGSHFSQVSTSLQSQRTSLDSLLQASNAYIQRILTEILRVGYGVSTTNLNQVEILRELKRAMDEASETIASRGITFGTPTADAGNSGGGVILRCTKDRFNNDLESGDVGIVKMEVIADKNNQGITPGNEQLRVSGDGIIKVDGIELKDSTNLSANISFNRAENGILTNPSFDRIDANITNVNQPGWRLSSAAAFTKITRNAQNPTGDIFRYTRNTEQSNSPSGASLQFNDNGSIAQYIARNARNRLNRNVPYFFVVRGMRKNGCNGTVTIKLGSQTESFTVSSFANNQWNNLVLGNGATDKGWYDVFFEDWEDNSVSPTIRLGVQIQIELSGRTTGEFVVGEILLIPGTAFNGSFVAAISGQSNEDALIGDKWTVEDTYTNTTYGGVMQESIRAAVNDYLPHVASGETFSDV